MMKFQRIQRALTLKNYINTLKHQLNEKDNQIKELTTALGKAQRLHQNTQVL